MRDILTGIGLGILMGILIGAMLYRHFVHWEPMQETTATFKPGHVQADGSADLTRIPTAPEDAGPPPHMLPPKAMETERIKVVVKPKPRHQPPVTPGSDGASVPGDAGMTCSCEPVVVDISRYLGPDGAGVIASSPDAEVDVSRSTYTPMLEQRPPPRHFVHLTAEPGRDGYTAAIGKRWGRFGVSIGGAKQPGQDARPIVGLEWNF